MFTPDTLANKRILIPGGGTGLGRAMAQGFAQAGASVALLGRRPGPLEEACASLRAGPQKPRCRRRSGFSGRTFQIQASST